MTIGGYLLVSFWTVLLYQTFLFAVALLRKDNSVADVGWGIGFLAVWAATFLLEPGKTPLQFLAGGLVAVWGLRLSGHILLRKRGRGEDFRYAQWRRQWGRAFVLRSYLQVFLLQGIFMLLIATPILLINHAPAGAIGAPAAAGVVVWLAGFVFESVGDGQLRRFRKDPASRGRIMTRGLWRFTRHPNYFGESLMWWGLAGLGFSVPGGWTGLISPLVLTFLLTGVSGIPLLEKKYRGNPEFEEYARRTNAFIPGPPKPGN